MSGIRCRTGGFGRLAAAAADSRGVVLIMTVYIVFAVGMMLFGFLFLNQGEANFAAFSRDSTIALGLAEAGIQESLGRINMSGAGTGTCFVNSLAGSGTCTGGAPTTNAVGFQAALQNNAYVFPILSVASYAGAQRAVRIFEQAVMKAGFGTIIFGPQVTFQGNAQPITGDSYSQLSLKFQNLAKSPGPGAGATATNLVTPQVLAGGTISIQAAGDPGPFTFECASNSISEVAPTPCPAGGRAPDGKGNTTPVNWHPMTPIGMSAADFNAIVSVWNNLPGNLPVGVQVTQATQNTVGVTYSPVSYSPPYWSSVSGANGKVYLIVSTVAFCVSASAPAVATGAGCGGAGYANYGSGTLELRYADWGLVSDDLGRTVAQTFFQPTTCTMCNSGGPNGKQNGVRVIPLLPTINTLAYACTTNMNPGFSAFYNVSGDTKTCANPPTQAGSSTFTGTKSNPEFLVIDNGAPGGTTVSISGTGSATGCSDNFNSANWGVILATGDINLQGLAFNGFIYTPGSVFSHGNPVIRGGVFSSTPPGTQVNQVDTLGTLAFCGGTTTMPMVPAFFTFQTVSWQDRPANQP